MQTPNKEDQNLRSFFNFLIIEKGLSKNTVKAYETDIKGFIKWINKNNKQIENKLVTFCYIFFFYDIMFCSYILM